MNNSLKKLKLEYNNKNNMENIKITLNFNKEADVERLTALLSLLHSELEEHEYFYGGFSLLYDDLVLLDSTIDQLMKVIWTK